MCPGQGRANLVPEDRKGNHDSGLSPIFGCGPTTEGKTNSKPDIFASRTAPSRPEGQASATLENGRE